LLLKVLITNIQEIRPGGVLALSLCASKTFPFAEIPDINSKLFCSFQDPSFSYGRVAEFGFDLIKASHCIPYMSCVVNGKLAISRTGERLVAQFLTFGSGKFGHLNFLGSIVGVQEI
jgi:hypothetical protein